MKVILKGTGIVLYIFGDRELFIAYMWRVFGNIEPIEQRNVIYHFGDREKLFLSLLSAFSREVFSYASVLNIELFAYYILLQIRIKKI